MKSQRALRKFAKKKRAKLERQRADGRVQGSVIAKAAAERKAFDAAAEAERSRRVPRRVRGAGRRRHHPERQGAACVVEHEER